MVLELCYEVWVTCVEPDTDPDGREVLYSFGNVRRSVREALKLE